MQVFRRRIRPYDFGNEPVVLDLHQVDEDRCRTLVDAEFDGRGRLAGAGAADRDIEVGQIPVIVGIDEWIEIEIAFFAALCRVGPVLDDRGREGGLEIAPDAAIGVERMGVGVVASVLLVNALNEG